MEALMGDLAAIPHRLRPSRTAELRKGLSDLANFVLSQNRQTLGIAYSYPAQFRRARFEGADGVPIAATYALHPEPRPGLVLLHGLFSNHLFEYVRKIAVLAYYEWGFNVAAVDLRSFGHTDLLSDAPSTGGWKEGEDVAAAALWLRSLGSTTVGALGISLGASAVLNAAHLEGVEDALDGGILAINGPADTRRAAAWLSRPVPLTHPAYPLHRLFATMLRARVRSGRWPEEIDDLLAPVERVSAPYYGVSAAEIWERSSARNHIAGTRVPLLVLHSEDDMIVPVEHARMLAEAAGTNPNVRVWIVPGGMHAAYDALDAGWTDAVYRTFFERWARYPRGSAQGDGCPGATDALATEARR
jgi:predicted alpha/beta-fold hydrolase